MCFSSVVDLPEFTSTVIGFKHSSLLVKLVNYRCHIARLHYMIIIKVTVKYFCSNKSAFWVSECLGDPVTVTKLS